MAQKLKFFKSKFKEYLKFNIIGMCNFIVSQIVYISLFSIFKLNYIIAYTLTSILSMSASYFLNSKITFRQNNYCPIKFSLSALVYVLEYIINMFIIVVLVNKFNFSELIAPILAPIVSTPIVFLMISYIIKRKKY